MDRHAVNKKISEHKCCVLCPTYNNASTLEETINKIEQYTNNIIIINDGSTDNTSKILESRFKHLTIIHFANNKGKGYALRQGFRKAISLGYQYAITIDSDGQHHPEDIPLFINKLEEGYANVIMIGARSFKELNMPGKSSFANRFSNFWFHFQTDIKLPDTQSGYRLYPLHAIKNTKYYTRKYEFELEVMVRAAWKGINIITIPVQVYYPPKEKRVTHFRPFIDFTRISILNTVLVFIALLYIKPRNFFLAVRKNGIKELWQTGHSNFKISTSIGFGVFMGIVPLWGYQMLLAVTLAFLMKLNKTLVVIASNISIPPMIPLILFFSFKMGEVFYDDSVHLSFNSGIN